MAPGLSSELARFFFACASEMNPELTVSSVQDLLSGLDVRVLSSTDGEVELEVQVSWRRRRRHQLPDLPGCAYPSR
jgi:hypothetical protein